MHNANTKIIQWVFFCFKIMTTNELEMGRGGKFFTHIRKWLKMTQHVAETDNKDNTQ